jgi:4'-phosphopantetheinyl transferase
VIERDEVHLWRVDLDQPDDVRRELVGLLEDDERARAARFARPLLQDRFAVGRGALRWVLARYLGMDPAALPLAYGPYGKPMLMGAGDLRFNLSHSEGQALLGVARGVEIGVDIEAVRPLRDRDAVARRTFTAGENRALEALPPALRDSGFFACWTRKEAVVKTTGIGFAFELDWFDVPVGPVLSTTDRPVELAVGGPSGVAGSYALWSPRVVESFAAAVAIRSADGTTLPPLRLHQRAFDAAPAFDRLRQVDP